MIKKIIFSFLFLLIVSFSLAQERSLIKCSVSIIEISESSFFNSKSQFSRESSSSDLRDVSLVLPAFVNPQSNSVLELTGVIGEDVWKLLVESLVRDGKGVIVSDPIIVVDDKQSGKMSAVNREPYKSVKIIGNTEQLVIEFIDVGITVEILPEILPNGTIRSLVNVESSEVLRNKFDEESMAEGIPVVSKRTTVTTVTLGKDEYMVLSGLTKEKRIVDIARVPFISRLLEKSVVFDFLNFLFKRTEERSIRTKLLIATNFSIVEDIEMQDLRKESYEFLKEKEKKWR